MWYCCTWRVLLAASDRLIGFITYEDTPPLFPRQSTTFGYISPRSYERYSDLVEKHINPELGKIRLTELRPDQVQAFYTMKVNEGLSKATVQYIHAILHKSLKQALMWGLVSRNVTDLVERPKPEKKTFRTWTPEDIKRFLDAVSDHRFFLIYLLAINTGLRQGELLGIHKESVDLKKGVIHVRHQVSTIRGKGLVVTEPKTDKSRRPVTIPKSTKIYLEKHLQGRGDGLIFTTSTGKPISPRNLLRHFKQVIEKEGLVMIRFHDLRHTHATLLLAAGVHPKVVQERLGHSQISLTLDTYSHVIPSLQDEAAEQFDKIVAYS
jgi:integrase